MRRVLNIMVYLVIIVILLNISACASSRKNSRSERPRKGKMKPCNCPKFGLYNINYAAFKDYC